MLTSNLTPPEEAMSDLHATRLNIYNPIHKALRAFMSDSLHRSGRVDASDAADVAASLHQLRSLLGFMRGHLKHESEFVHTAMEKRAPGSTGTAEADHVHHLSDIANLEMLCDLVEASRPAARAVQLGHLHRALSVFVGENLVHMNMEETANNAVLWAHYSDEELMQIERSIVATIAPEEMAFSMQWMIPALNPQERAALFLGMRAGAPAPVFAGLLQMATGMLDEDDSRKLEQALAA
jgi:hypothetical protein